MKLPHRIRTWRDYVGVTQRRVAERLGISSSAVGQWEQDDGTEPTQAHLAAFCDLLGISLAQFWGPVPEKPRRKKAA